MNSPERFPVNGRADRHLKKRYRAEARFKAIGLLSVLMGLCALLALFVQIVSSGLGAFHQTYIELDIVFDEEVLELSDVSDQTMFSVANFDGLVQEALKQRFPKVASRRDRQLLYRMVSIGAGFDLRDDLSENPQLFNQSRRYWLLADDDIDTYFKGLLAGDAYTGRVNEKQVAWVDDLFASGQIKTRFNTLFFTSGDSAEPEMAGIRGALVGSLLTLFITFILSFPIGIAAAIYLEEYADKNRLTDFIEVNINNLAAVPSVIFGLLGLAIFLNFFGLPRSAPLVGGLVLTLMTLPTIIISSRASIKAVPPSIRSAAMSMGASKMQVIIHHVLPLAMPGMLTGAIIGMAQALGETAPLLMVGMVAFIADTPNGVTDPATVLPVQIFLWADSPERAFTERTSAAIMVLLVFLVSMNSLAIWLRKRLERRW